MRESVEPSRMNWQPRRFSVALIVLAVGLTWLACAWSSNWVVAVIGTVPGVFLVATGIAQWLWAGDRQIPYHMALVAPASVLLALVLGYWLGWLACLVLFFGGLLVFVLAGWVLWVQHAVPAGVSPPGRSLGVLIKMASDAAMLGFFVNCARVPHGKAIELDRAELQALDELAEGQDWAAHPEQLHGPVEAFHNPNIERVRARGVDYEWLTAQSLYAPELPLPGLARWQGYVRNRTVGVRILRHREAVGRPWLLCVHGYRMGTVGFDFQMFDVKRLHHRLGFNLAMPILPLHGVRSATYLSGGLFLDDPLLNMLHAQAQSLLDLRCTIAWIREMDPAARIGVLGYSLGGYHAALLAGHEPGLECVIAGIPMTNITATLWQHMPLAHVRYLATQELGDIAVGERLKCMSPLAVKPLVPRDRRFIFAARGDQLVAPEQPLALWHHWGEPEIHWYDGSHVSVRHEPGVDAFIDQALTTTLGATQTNCVDGA